MRFLFLLIAIIAAPAQVDPREIVRRSVTLDDQSWKLARSYTYVQRETDRELDSNGKVKTTHTRTREVMYIGQRPYRRLLEKIAEKQYDVFTSKVALSTSEKLRILGKGFLKRLK